MKRMNNRVWVILLGLCMLLSGCGRIVQWARPMFDQGTELVCYEGKAQDWLRYAVVYHGADIEGMFDALWLNQPVQEAYAQAHAQRFGTLSPSLSELRRTGDYPAFAQSSCALRATADRGLWPAGGGHGLDGLSRMGGEDSISFIVLSLFNKPLGLPESEWGVFLRVGAKQYAPVSIKPHDLEPEYQDVFDYRYDKFKNVYMVQFDAVDERGATVLTPKTPCLELVFRSTHKQAVLAWHLDCLACNWAARADVVANEWQVYKPRRDLKGR